VKRGRGSGRFITKDLLKHLYWQEKLSLPKIGERLQRSSCTVLWYFKKYGLPRRSRLEATLKQPNLAPTPTLSYILGVILGDGTTSIYRSKQHPSSTYYIVDLAVKSQTFVNSFGEALKKIGLHPCFCLKRSRYNGNPYLTYRVMTQSKVFVQWIRSLNLEDIEDKILVTDEDKVAFVRGIYESEGYYGKKELSISNTDDGLVHLLFRCLRSLGFTPSKHTSQIPSGNFYVLRILGGRVERSRFVTMINPCIKRGD
jgi:hypothetical protein